MQKQFENFMASLLSREKLPTPETLIVTVDKKISVSVKKDQINPRNRNLFIAFLKPIPRIGDGISWKDLVGEHPLYIKEHQAKIVQGVGHILGAWELIDPTSEIGKRIDEEGLLPMNKGLRW